MVAYNSFSWECLIFCCFCLCASCVFTKKNFRIFDSASNDLNNSKIPNTELKNKPDGWETTARAQDGSIWEMSQREEDILLQEFERRIAFNKFQVCGSIYIPLTFMCIFVPRDVFFFFFFPFYITVKILWKMFLFLL